jgi:ferredoxin
MSSKLNVVNNDSDSKKGKKKLRIRVDRNLCTGIATCVALAPDVFELDDELKAVTKDGDYVEDYAGTVDYDTILTAAMSCPPQAIFIYDEETGEQLFPK